MPCTLEPWEVESEERRINKEKYGKPLTDTQLLQEVACALAKLVPANVEIPDFVSKWMFEHAEQDMRAEQERKSREMSIKKLKSVLSKLTAEEQELLVDFGLGNEPF